ncbi:hypothetical protein [Shewanella sp. SM95]|uniref:hypothetical protein n=1 Tax=Shewanella TaxID=22 RepID=UPI0021D803E1|nr:hypothetical protein [Shewanella sp. SM95]MCU7997289.1 hypothetical protein [Shewanella sp. SM95]
MNNSTELTAAIDNDEGLKSKRKLLTVTSLILLGLSFSGATIDEANTFIFKIKFANQNGLGILLVLSIVFLMVRYYNYAKLYHDKLYKLWSDRLVNRSFFYSRSPYDDQDGGIVADSRCSELNAGLSLDGSVRRWEHNYVCGLPFTRFIVHYWGYNDCNDEDRMDSVNIFTKFGLQVYLRCLWLEAKEQIRSFFTHRENLDILAPYVLGCLAIGSYYFNTELMSLLNFISPQTSK